MIAARRVAASSSSVRAPGLLKGERLTPRERDELAGDNGSHRPTVEANVLTAGPKRKRNPAIQKFLLAWLRKKFDGQGVDALVSRPFIAALMSLELAAHVDRLEADEAKYAANALRIFMTDHPLAVNAINAGCRDAMSLRKEGLLAASSSLAMKLTASRAKGGRRS